MRNEASTLVSPRCGHQTLQSLPPEGFPIGRLLRSPGQQQWRAPPPRRRTAYVLTWKVHPTGQGAGTEFWFTEAAAVGLIGELEFAALETALRAAHGLPPDIYVALNISPDTCLDPRLPGLLQRSGLPLNRIVLELTERLAVSDYKPLLSVLAPMRRMGLRIAVDDAGSGFASMRHILHIQPEIIKLDRSLISGIDDDQGQRALGAAMVEFARQIDATLVAEGIETPEELASVARLGMTAGQGYLLGRPSIHPRDWASWYETPRPSEDPDRR